jgi:DNA replication protein DnaC
VKITTNERNHVVNQQTIDKLNSMRLLGLAAEYQRQTDNASQYGPLSFDERLGFLIDQEWESRQNRRLLARLRWARLKQQASVEEIDYTHARALDRTQMRQLARCEWIRQKENLLVVGPTGTGKTYIACALANQACREGFNAMYTRLPNLLADIETARAERKYRTFMKRLSRTNLLVIDDWGLSPLGDTERRDILEVLEERYDIGSVLIASQIPVKSWHALMGDATLADAILDRLVHNAHRIEMKGESMRKMKKGLQPEKAAK